MLVSSLCFWNFCQGNCKWYTRMIWFNCMKLLQQPVFLIIRAPRTLHTAEVGTVRPLLGSFWNGHAMLCLFQILFMCCECTIDHSLMLVWWKSHNNFSCLCCRLLFWNFLWFPLFFRLKGYEISSKLCYNVFETVSKRSEPHALWFPTTVFPFALAGIKQIGETSRYINACVYAYVRRQPCCVF